MFCKKVCSWRFDFQLWLLSSNTCAAVEFSPLHLYVLFISHATSRNEFSFFLHFFLRPVENRRHDANFGYTHLESQKSFVSLKSLARPKFMEGRAEKSVYLSLTNRKYGWVLWCTAVFFSRQILNSFFSSYKLLSYVVVPLWFFSIFHSNQNYRGLESRQYDDSNSFVCRLLYKDV